MSVRKGSKIIASSGLIEVGAVDDVLVDGTSVVTDKVAEIDLTGKQDKLSSANAGTNVTITEVDGVVKINATSSGGTDDFEELTNRPSYNGTVMTHSTNIPEVKTATWDAKQNAITGAATTITSSNLTTDRALISNASGKVAVSEVTSTELGYLDGVTSSIQTQLNGKAIPSDITTAISTHNADNTAHSDIRSAIAGKSTVSVSDTGTSEDEVKYITIDGVEKKLAGGGAGRNIGDIFYTTRTDTALAGAVECNGGTYNTEDYTGEGSIGELLEAGKLDYISLTNYETAISTKGWCDKIGWNGTGTTSFRVPTLTPHIIQKNNIPVVGNGITLGLTNGTDNVGVCATTESGQSYGLRPNSARYGEPVATGNFGSSKAGSFGVTTDPTKSGIIADTSDTAQLRVMFQLFNGATDEAVATVGTVVADVSGLKNMSNVTPTGKETVVGWGMPDYSAGTNVSLPFTAPTQGVLYIALYITSDYYKLYVNDNQVGYGGGTNNDRNTITVLLSENDVVTKTGGSVSSAYFYPCKGVA